MLAQISQTETAALEALNAVTDTADLEAWRVAHLGRSSPLMSALGDLGKLPKEERPLTSPGQIHAMRQFAPEPIRVILPGMCYRYEQITARSDIQFYQVEGLAVGRHITFSDLKGTLSDFARRMFGQTVRTRFRADHFPFTEPSAEMDVECFVCGGPGCALCKHTRSLGIFGFGRVPPPLLSDRGVGSRPLP